MNGTEATTNGHQKKDLRIAVIGAGMGGLACALALAKQGFRKIEVYEYASNLGFVGAGIQLAPNLARVLDKLGCWSEIEKKAVLIYETSIRQGSSGEELAHVDLRSIKENYGYQHRVGHRSALAGALYDSCVKEEKNIKFNFSTSIEKVISYSPRPTFLAKPRDGEPYEVEADLVFAADGVKSVARTQMMQHLSLESHTKDTGQAAYRIMLNRDQMKDDPEMRALIDGNAVTRWIGEKRHIIAYPISNNTIYNISTVQPDANFAAAPSATYTTKGSKSSMMEIFSDFCPITRRMLDLVPEGEVCEWKLRVHSALPTWSCGSVALIGDACHPTLPHLNQGAAQAIEDAAVLAVCLSHCPDTTPESLNKMLQVYEKLRKQRTETLVDMAAASGRSLHLGDGEAKAERDRQFALLKERKGAVPDKWADADTQKMIFSHDCIGNAEAKFDEIYASL